MPLHPKHGLSKIMGTVLYLQSYILKFLNLNMCKFNSIELVIPILVWFMLVDKP